MLEFFLLELIEYVGKFENGSLDPLVDGFRSRVTFNASNGR